MTPGRIVSLVGDDSAAKSELRKTETVYLVACVAQKVAHACRAEDLYRSDWFLKARAYVRGQGVPWYILSAKHGLVAPECVIEPYNMTLAHMPIGQRRDWGARVAVQLDQLIEPSAPVVMLAGRLYRDPLTTWAGDRVSVPMAGLGIGQQKAWLAHAVAQR